MKTNTALLISILCSCLLLLQCAKEAPQEILKTRLLITLRDEKGASVSGTVVRLYKNAADPGIVRTADSTGVLLYPDLEIATYYWLAKKDCKTNLASQTTLGRPLVDGAILYGYSVMAETSTLRLKNTDSITYKLSDSTLSLTLPADTGFITYPKAGRHRLRLQKQSTPTVFKDTILQFNCGDTIVLNVPF